MKKVSERGATAFWRHGIQFECQQSGKCCASRGEYGFVYLTGADARRMAKHLGLGDAEFQRRYCARTDGWLHLRHPERDCEFLEGTGCGIYRARPEQCRTWPFWPENMPNARTWRTEVATFCPGIGQGREYAPDEIVQILRRQEKADIG